MVEKMAAWSVASWVGWKVVSLVGMMAGWKVSSLAESTADETAAEWGAGKEIAKAAMLATSVQVSWWVGRLGPRWAAH